MSQLKNAWDILLLIHGLVGNKQIKILRRFIEVHNTSSHIQAKIPENVFGKTPAFKEVCIIASRCLRHTGENTGKCHATEG
jgi:hypothetical protein